ncbi:hypothetical protein KSP35_03235 [Aquihabitans sp. G128]|uniref:hypothetical protein n=1 Tax=Aquihabitans sp. G128 TaxID=2849779 RepID=UPI001C22DC8D|nr:hypothetical protein [Aquihabitans sp. G128]QXC61859.1 hypothetical protein KSP35_03235 [Aquihabitans sp. G128]
MFKRIIWMGTGMAVGAGGAFWAKRKVETTVERYLPEQVADRAAATARGLGVTVKAAAVEGREAMRQREQELRSQVEARTFVGGRDAAPAPTPPAAGHGRRAARVATPRPATPGSRRKPRR